MQQPLDLSLRPAKDEQRTQNDNISEHISSETTCMSSLCNVYTHRMSPYNRISKTETNSPKLGILSSLLSCTNSHVYSRRETSSSRGISSLRSTSTASSSCYHLTTTLENQSRYPPTTSQSSSICVPGQSSSICVPGQSSSICVPAKSDVSSSYHDNSNSSTGFNSHNEVSNSHRPTTPQDHQYHDSNIPSFLELDSAVVKNLRVNYNSEQAEESHFTHKEHAEESHFTHNYQTVSRKFFAQHSKRENTIQTDHCNLKTTALCDVCKQDGCDCDEIDSKQHCPVSQTSHKHTGKRKKNVTTAASTSGRSPTVQYHHQQETQQQYQMSIPDSSSNLNLYKSDANRSCCDLTLSSPAINTHLQFTNSFQQTSPSQSSSSFCVESKAKQKFLPSVSLYYLDPQVGQDTKSDQKQTPETSKDVSSTTQTLAATNCTPISTFIRDCEIMEYTNTSHSNTMKDKNTIDSEQRVHLSSNTTSPEHETNKNCTKICLLDFWITKLLLESSIESQPPEKPYRVDYICTENGEKKIRCRLVDLIELQVEHSMKT